MIEILKQGLVITGIGMGLVFVMIFLLWGIMALLVWLTNPREKATKKSVTVEPEAEAVATKELVAQVEETDMGEDETQQLAAAIAVAFALKRPRQQSLAQETSPANQSSGWLNVGRAQQMLSRNRGRN